MKCEDWVLGSYMFGIPLDWAYWVARGINPDGTAGVVGQHVTGAFAGIVVAPFWPLHTLVEAWFWILG